MPDVVVLAAIVTCASALGLSVLGALGALPRAPRDHVLAGLLVGLGLTSMLGLVLAGAGTLRPGWLVAAGVVALAIGGRRLGAVAALRRPRGRAAWLLAAVCVLMLAAELPATLAPPVGGDQTWYALVYPRLYAAAGALVPTPWSYWGQQQLLEGFLSAVAFTLRGDVLARLVYLLYAGLGAAALATLTRRHLARSLGPATAAMFLTLPMTCALVLRAGPGLALVAYAALATSAVLDWARGERAGDLARAAVLAGLGAGTSVLGLLVPVVLALVVLVVTIERAWPIGRVLSTGVAMGLVVVAMASPWYARNALDVGDPFHPFGGRFFTARHWTPAAADYLAEQREQHRPATADDDTRALVREVVRRPWRLTMDPASPRSANDVGPFVLAFLPAVVLLRRRRDVALIVASLAVAFVCGSTWTEPRAALAGVALGIAAAVPAARMLCGRRVAAAVLTFTLVANVATASQVDRRMWVDQVRAGIGLMAPDAFLRTWSPRYRFWQLANEAIPPDERVALLEKTPHPYWVARPFMLLSYLEQGLVDYRRVDTVDALAHTLAEMQVRWVAVDTAGLEAAGDPFEASVTRLWRALLAAQGERVVRADGYALYALRPVTAVATAADGEVAWGHALRAPQGLSVVCDLGTTRLHPKVLF